MKSICFVLPKFTRQPIGGYKIVFEYANRLSRLNYKVSICFLNDELKDIYPNLKILLRPLADYFTWKEPSWFKLDKKIKKISCYEGHNISKLSSYDVLIATGYQTVEIVNQSRNNTKAYLIQGYETWNLNEDYIHKTYNYNLKKIVVSKWLKEIVDNYSKNKSLLITNPIDTEIYSVSIEPQNRKKHSIALLYHEQPLKGVKYALEAINIVKEKYLDLSVMMFGMFNSPGNLPDWISYKKGATQKETVEIYNSVEVFLCASIEEGFGLTGYEAMACGAALVSTSYKGVLEYAVNEKNALLSPIKDSKALAENIIRLFEDTNLRIKIATNGIESVKNNGWDSAIKKMSDYLDLD